MSLSQEDLIWLRSHPCLDYLALIKRHASGGKDDETWQMILRQSVLGDLTETERVLVLQAVKEIRDELTSFLNRVNLKQTLEELSRNGLADVEQDAAAKPMTWTQHTLWKSMDK